MCVYLHPVHEEVLEAQDLSWCKSGYDGFGYIHSWTKLGRVGQVLTNLGRTYTNTNYNLNHLYTITYLENPNIRTTLRYTAVILYSMSLYTATIASNRPIVLSVTVARISYCAVVDDRI